MESEEGAKVARSTSEEPFSSFTSPELNPTARNAPDESNARQRAETFAFATVAERLSSAALESAGLNSRSIINSFSS